MLLCRHVLSPPIEAVVFGWGVNEDCQVGIEGNTDILSPKVSSHTPTPVTCTWPAYFSVLKSRSINGESQTNMRALGVYARHVCYTMHQCNLLARVSCK